MPGSFVLMSFPDPMDMDSIYIDSMFGDLFLESETEIFPLHHHVRHAADRGLEPGPLA